MWRRNAIIKTGNHPEERVWNNCLWKHEEGIKVQVIQRFVRSLFSWQVEFINKHPLSEASESKSISNGHEAIPARVQTEASHNNHPVPSPLDWQVNSHYNNKIKLGRVDSSKRRRSEKKKVDAWVPERVSSEFVYSNFYLLLRNLPFRSNYS